MVETKGLLDCLVPWVGCPRPCGVEILQVVYSPENGRRVGKWLIQDWDHGDNRRGIEPRSDPACARMIRNHLALVPQQPGFRGVIVESRGAPQLHRHPHVALSG